MSPILKMSLAYVKDSTDFINTMSDLQEVSDDALFSLYLESGDHMAIPPVQLVIDLANFAPYVRLIMQILI